MTIVDHASRGAAPTGLVGLMARVTLVALMALGYISRVVWWAGTPC